MATAPPSFGRIKALLAWIQRPGWSPALTGKSLPGYAALAPKKAELSSARPAGGDCGIIYCATRKTVEEVHGFLQDNGIRAVRCTMPASPDEERQQSQEDFLFDRCRIMVATNAFRDGHRQIQRAVRHPLQHAQGPGKLLPGSGPGRPGRAAARCILLYSGQDVRTQQFLIEKSSENEALDPETARQLRVAEEDRLRRMTFYCHSKRCLRGSCCGISGKKGPENCGNCSVCLGLYQQESPARAPGCPASAWPAQAQPESPGPGPAHRQPAGTFRAAAGPAGFPGPPAGVPAFVIFTDKTLLELAVEAPQPRQLGEISGVGEHKAAAWGRILAEIRSFLRQEGEL